MRAGRGGFVFGCSNVSLYPVVSVRVLFVSVVCVCSFHDPLEAPIGLHGLVTTRSFELSRVRRHFTKGHLN